MKENNVLILDANNEECSVNIAGNATELQFLVRGVGLDEQKKVYLNFKNGNVDIGQTFFVSDNPAWRTIHFTNFVNGALEISRPNYNISPETAEGVSVVISGIRWR